MTDLPENLLWDFPHILACYPHCTGASKYLEMLQSITEEEAPGIEAYRAWYQEVPPLSLPGTTEWMTWRNRCPPAPPLRCPRCKSSRIIEISGEFHGQVNLDGKSSDELLDNLDVGGCSIHILICAQCGQAQGKWPLPEGVMDQ